MAPCSNSHNLCLFNSVLESSKSHRTIYSFTATVVHRGYFSYSFNTHCAIKFQIATLSTAITNIIIFDNISFMRCPRVWPWRSISTPLNAATCILGCQPFRNPMFTSHSLLIWHTHTSQLYHVWYQLHIHKRSTAISNREFKMTCWELGEGLTLEPKNQKCRRCAHVHCAVWKNCNLHTLLWKSYKIIIPYKESQARCQNKSLTPASSRASWRAAISPYYILF